MERAVAISREDGNRIPEEKRPERSKSSVCSNRSGYQEIKLAVPGEVFRHDRRDSRYTCAGHDVIIHRGLKGSVAVARHDGYGIALAVDRLAGYGIAVDTEREVELAVAGEIARQEVSGIGSDRIIGRFSKRAVAFTHQDRQFAALARPRGSDGSQIEDAIVREIAGHDVSRSKPERIGRRGLERAVAIPQQDEDPIGSSGGQIDSPVAVEITGNHQFTGGRRCSQRELRR